VLAGQVQTAGNGISHHLTTCVYVCTFMKHAVADRTISVAEQFQILHRLLPIFFNREDQRCITNWLPGWLHWFSDLLLNVFMLFAFS
jgi:hypothetical protein